MDELTESITVENVVASSDIGQELALDSLARDLAGTDYNPENFPGVVLRMQDPKAAVLIFHSGKIVCTGANSIEAVTTALEHVFEKFQQLGIDVQDSPPITVQNVVSSADLGQTLNLNAIAIGLGLEQIEYEPEQFPGLVYRLEDPAVVALLFGSGKLVITGGKARADAEEALVAISDRLTELGLLS